MSASDKPPQTPPLSRRGAPGTSTGSVSAASTFPWPLLIWAGLSLLKWPPEVFWKATLRELTYALTGGAHALPGAPTRTDLAALMKQFPDHVPRAPRGTNDE